MQKVIDLSRILSTEGAYVYVVNLNHRIKKKWHSTDNDTVLWNTNIVTQFLIK